MLSRCTGRPVAGFLPVRNVAPLPIWREALHAAEGALLRASPVYWGGGVPRGDGSAVIIVPAFLSRDCHLVELRWWLNRMGYTVFRSGIGLNADCPNVLTGFLADSVEHAYRLTRNKVHVIGHSLGGLLARAIAVTMPDRVRSLMTLGSPFRGIVTHPAILYAALGVQWLTLTRRGSGVPPSCYSESCPCVFSRTLTRAVPSSVRQTAIYTTLDGAVDWRYCMTGDPAIDCAVPATHSGLVLNPAVYEVLAHRLARAHASC